MEESKKESSILKEKILSRKTPLTISRTKKQKTKDIESGELKDSIKYIYKIPAEWKLILI
jgi:hypothetical protein